jgi:hypothetical protein
MPRDINFSKSNKFPEDDFGPDDYSEMTDVQGAEDYDPGRLDPLAKERSESFMGRDIDAKLAGGGQVGKGYSYAVGPVSDPTQYGRPGKMFEIPFEREQIKAVGAELADESAIEAALDAEIDKLEIASRNADPVGIMEAETRIKGLQEELNKAIQVTSTKKETFGESYETQQLKETISKRLEGKVTPENLELMAEDVKPLSTTSKGKGPGIKNAEAIIETGLERKSLPTEKLESGEYSQAKSGMKQVSIERELNKPKTIDKAKINNTSSTSGSVEEIVKAQMGKTDPITQKPYKTMTGVTKTGDIQLDKPSSFLDVQEAEAQAARIAERRGQKPTGKFQTKKVSGTKVSSVTPDAPKQQEYSGLKEADSPELKQYVDEFKAMGQTSQKALVNAQRMMKLQKIRGKGKGKGKLLTTLGALGIGAILSKDK